MPVDRITSADVLGCLAPIWTSKPAAARKARNRIAAVFRWCIGRNHRADNPVDRAVVALPRANGHAPRHYRALPHREVAAALAEACLAHVPRSQVVQAYQRSDLLERRAEVPLCQQGRDTKVENA